jgi:hypothetical protein
MRCAAFLAFSTLSPASNTASLSFAPPRDLMPPLLIDRFDRHVGGHFHDLSLAGIGSRHRCDQSDLDFLGLRAKIPCAQDRRGQ